LLLTSNLSAERKKMPLADVNIARAVALVEDYCCLRYAANAIEAPLGSGHRAVRRFQETGQYTRRPGSGRKRATTHRHDRFLNNNGVPLFLPVSVDQFVIFLTLHHPAARQFCRSTYTITDNTIK
jgi:hypothetical protein